MANATRTQIYLTAGQRAALDEVVTREGRTLADVVREAIDAYLANAGASPAEALSETFGSMPEIDVPSRDEWDRG